MPLSIGLNGFGRIGRIILRACFVRSNIEIIAINDPVIDIEYICYLIKFDSTHGKLNNEITYSDDEITIKGKKIKIFHETIPSLIPWHTLGVEYVVEASGMFFNMDKALGHLSSTSVKCVLVTTPSSDIPMLILGANEQLIKTDQRVISCASSTLYCLAPIVKILEDNYGISEGFVTSIHAMTPSLKTLDGMCLKGRLWRDHRSIHQNIIPAPTGACKALGKIIPSVSDKFCGLALRVPIVNVSVLDITVKLNKRTSIREIAAQIEKESKGEIKNIITTCYDEAVSSDFMNSENSCVLDVNASLQLTPTSYKLICWYENEFSYACRVIDTIFFLQERFKSQESSRPFVPIKPRSDTDCEMIRKLDAMNMYKTHEKLKKTSLLNHNILKTKILNAPTVSNPDRHTSQEAEKNVNEAQTTKIIICDDESNGNITEGINVLTRNIGNRERLELAKKELAEIASKTEDLLKESVNNNSIEINPTSLPPSSNDKTRCVNNIKILVAVNNEEGTDITKHKNSYNIDKHNENNLHSVTNRNSNVLLVASGSFVSQRLHKLDTNDSSHELQTRKYKESKSQVIKDNMREIIKTSQSALPMYDSFKLMNTTENVAQEKLLDNLLSEPESDVSFRIDKTKSQVIDIKDLVSSTDELACLDKICRVIEISDELSDKMLSALKFNSNSGKKAWSLKEFCEKIKLDDFVARCSVIDQKEFK